MIKKILVADDDQNIVRLLKIKLEAQHYQVISAEDGQQCLMKMMTEQPDLIILDITMPKLDGYDVLIAMNQQWALIDKVSKMPPVIILTGLTDEKGRELVEKEHISAYLKKPLDMDELLKTIEAVGGSSAKVS